MTKPGQEQNYLPSEDEIRMATQRIQQTWSPQERIARNARRATPYHIPVYTDKPSKINGFRRHGSEGPTSQAVSITYLGAANEILD